MKRLNTNLETDQRGLTLVELLAVLVLISLVTGIIWTTINISIRHNTVETTKTQLQQEANAIITKLQAIHRQKDCYQLNISKNEVSVQNCKDREVFFEVLGDNYEYIAKTNQLLTQPIEPKKTDLSNLSLTIRDPKNKRLSFTVETSITRYKTGGGKGDESEQ